MRLDKFVTYHVPKRRLLEIAGQVTRLSKAEFDHLDSCHECIAAYAKSILRIARTRAKEKTSNRAEKQP